MKARVHIELPPGVVLTGERRAALLSACAKQLGVHDHDLEKALPEVRKLPHRALQTWIDETGTLYESLMHNMIEDIGEILSPMSKAEQLYIGPHGGRWRNPQHTEHYDERRGGQLMLDFERRPHYFASGSNHEGEIQGFHSIGMNLGVAAHEVNHSGEQALHALKGKGTKVFVDSGAFSEVDFNFPARKANPKKGIKVGDLPYPGKPIGPLVVAPIEHEEWTKRLDLYDRLASSLGSQLYAVAPDKVAFQDDTYERLKTYKDRILALHAKGANILVPLQKGTLSLADFDRKVEALLGFDYVRAIPMKKDATSTKDFADFLRERHPKRVHLLGLGPESDRYDEVMQAAHEASPGTEIFLDSVKITSAVENAKPKANGEWSRPRKLTAATNRQVSRLSSEAFAHDAYSENIGDPTSWLPKTKRGEVADAAKLVGVERQRFMKDPTTFVREKDDGVARLHDPMISAALDTAWHRFFVEDFSVAEKKREAIREVWDPNRPTPLHLMSRAHALSLADTTPPEHRKDTEHYRWEALVDAEGAHREAVAHAVNAHEMTPAEYAELHEPDYGPVHDFLKDPSRGEWVTGKPPSRG